MDIPIEQRRALAQAAVTLDGLPARIVGIRSAFARVVTLDGTRAAEWSWSTVARICARGGCFTT